MAKPTTIKIRLNSTAGTGHFYVTKKNARTMTEKMVVKKYDPVKREHVNTRKARSSKVAPILRGPGPCRKARPFPFGRSGPCSCHGSVNPDPSPRHAG